MTEVRSRPAPRDDRAGLDGFALGEASKLASLLALRVTMGLLLFWWGLAKGLNTGVGQAISDGFYGGMFSVETLLIVFGWAQAALGLLLAVGLFRRLLLPVQFVINLFVAGSVWWAIVDPFWLYLPGEKPFEFPALFYPSAIILAASWLLIAFRREDALAFDRRFGRV